METLRSLVINPGSTSTKIAVYEDEKSVFLKTIRHDMEELKDFKKISDQFQFRKNLIIKELEAEGIAISSLSAVVGRGGLIKPVEGGVYEVNDALKKDLEVGVMGEHASNLGGLIALDIVKDIPNARAFIANPVVVDEMQDVARIAGHPKFERISIFHALNHKAIAMDYAKKQNKPYEELNVIVAHLGGGITVGAHRKGRVIDVNNGLNGEGPFSPERSGTLPTGQLVDVCFSGEYTKDQVKKMLVGEGGLMAYFGTNSALELQNMVEAGDEKANLVQNAMGYQVAKMIGEMAVVLEGKVDAILITGGIAYNKHLVAYIENMVKFIAPVHAYPGEDEMSALAMNGLLVLRGEIECKQYV